MQLSYVISTQPTRFAAVSLAENIEATIARLAELGYTGVELAVREPRLLDVPHLQKLLGQSKLQVPALGTGQAYVEEGLSFTDPEASIRERAIERIEAHIALAKELKSPPSSLNRGGEGEIAPLVIIGLIRGKSVGPTSKALLRETLQRLARTARPADVRLAIEPINRYETNLLTTVAETLTLIDEIAEDNLGVLFDTFHANIEEPSIEASMRACAERLFHVHVADSNRWAPGFGHTNFTPIISTLREMKYNGWVSAEILQQPDREQAMRMSVESLQRFHL